MGLRTPLTCDEKEQIYRGKLAGHSLRVLAQRVGCSIVCARKWWRQGREAGLQGLRTPRRGRTASGILSQFDPAVVAQALAYKQAHHGWGPHRVLLELQHTPALAGCSLPSRSRLAAFFKQACPEALAPRCAKASRPRPPAKPTAVHELWQLDSQEGIRLQDHTRATICNLREPVGAAILASQAFEVTTAKRWRKLRFPELRAVLRHAFAEWGTLPAGVQTDNELRLAGDPNDQFPSDLTLWLAGLGVRHRFIRPGHPRDQPQIERTHRTLDGRVLPTAGLADCAALQAGLDHERYLYNEILPCFASDCAGVPPVTAHPELLKPPRPYRCEWEGALFDIQRVYAYLATFSWQRKVNSVGQVMLGGLKYSVGRRYGGQVLQVSCAISEGQWCFSDAQGLEVARRPIQHLDARYLTGLEPASLPALEEPLQLTLPYLVG